MMEGYIKCEERVKVRILVGTISTQPVEAQDGQRQKEMSDNGSTDGAWSVIRAQMPMAARRCRVERWRCHRRSPWPLRGSLLTRGQLAISRHETDALPLNIPTLPACQPANRPLLLTWVSFFT